MAAAVRKIGTIGKIDYTFHGFGNQYTTIDGKEYIPSGILRTVFVWVRRLNLLTRKMGA